MDLSVLPQNHPSLPSPQNPSQSHLHPLGNPCIPPWPCQSSSCCPAKPPPGKGTPCSVSALPGVFPAHGRALQPLSRALHRAAVQDVFPRQQAGCWH